MFGILFDLVLVYYSFDCSLMFFSLGSGCYAKDERPSLNSNNNEEEITISKFFKNYCQHKSCITYKQFVEIVNILKYFSE